VVDVARAVGAEWPGDIDVGINRAAERIDADNNIATASGELIDRSAESGIIDEITDKRCVIDRLPGRAIKGHCAKGRYGLPVTLKDPLLDQLAVLPVEPLLIPDLRLPVLKRCKDACLELHENIVAIRQWRLVVDKQIAVLIGGRSRSMRIINN